MSFVFILEPIFTIFIVKCVVLSPQIQVYVLKHIFQKLNWTELSKLGKFKISYLFLANFYKCRIMNEKDYDNTEIDC